MTDPPVPSAAAGMSPAMRYHEPADLGAIRAFVRAHAAALGMAATRTELLLLAVSELATNTLQHTNGGGLVRVSTQANQLICDVIDSGPMRAFGRTMPPAAAVHGRGLAIVERVCDHVDVTAGPDGTQVRLRLDL